MNRMNLKKVRQIYAGLGLAAIVMIWVGAWLGSVARLAGILVIVLGILFAVAGIAFALAKWRCPHCGEFLMTAGKFCSHCGNMLDDLL